MKLSDTRFSWWGCGQPSRSWVAGWVQSLQERGRSAHTLRAYRRLIEAHPGESATADGLVVRLWEVWPESAASRHAAVCAWRSYETWLMARGLVEISAAAQVATLQPEVLRERSISIAEVRSLYEVARTPVELALLDALYGLGLRAGELLRARRDGLAGIWILGKGGKVRVLEVDGLNPWPALGLRYKRVYRVIKALVGRLGFWMSPHWLRHGHATHALDAGAQMAEVSRQLGHSSPAITLRYIHGRRSTGSLVAQLTGRARSRSAREMATAPEPRPSVLSDRTSRKRARRLDSPIG